MSERERQRERERILNVFEAHRMAPGAAFDEAHFLDFLIEDPPRKRAAFDSAAGRKRVDAFIDQVQLDYAIHLPRREREANYPLDAFVARVMELRDSPRTSLKSFRTEPGTGANWAVVALSNGIAALPLVAMPDRPAMIAVTGVLMLAINGFWYWYAHRRDGYREVLHRQLLAADEAQRKKAGQSRLSSL